MIFHMRRMTPLAALLVLVGCQREPESCLDLFGSGQHKTCFLVFDLCANFEFFGQDLNIDDPTLPDTLTSRLVKARLGLARQLATATSDDNGVHALHTDVLDHLHQHVSTMTVDNFLVRKHRREVEQFTDRKRWDALSDEDAETVAHVLAPLPNGLEPEPPETKQFDLLMYRLMVALLDRSRAFTGYRDEVRYLAGRLEEVSSIPLVKQQLVLIEAVQTDGHPEGVEGMFDDADVDNIIAIVRGFNEVVGAQFGTA
jgi:type I restriction enzyme R subunit